MSAGALGRRDFLLSAAAVAAMSGCRTASASVGRPCVFFSDAHLPGTLADDTGQGDELSYFVRRVLAMDPLPKVVVDFGDLAYDCGRKADYERANEILLPLRAAGVPVVHTMGNHDRRERFFEANADCCAASPVPGRTVGVVDLGNCDLILMDTLHQGPNPDDRGPKGGTLDDAQYDWLLAELPRRTRPFILGGHHPAGEIDLDRGRSFQQVLDVSDKIVGYVHGHDHVWKDCFLWVAKTADGLLPSRCLPSTGMWGDIGHVVVRPGARSVSLELLSHDFYYPRCPQDGTRLPRWRDRVDNLTRAATTFAW